MTQIKRGRAQSFPKNKLLQEAKRMKYKISYGKSWQVKMHGEGGRGERSLQKRTTITNQ